MEISGNKWKLELHASCLEVLFKNLRIMPSGKELMEINENIRKQMAINWNVGTNFC